MRYADVVARLGLQQVCFGDCGLTDRAHRGAIFLGVIHWRERRLTRRGLRRFLLLVAKRDRLQTAWESQDIFAPPRGFLNDPKLAFYHLWHDEMEANRMASSLGVRFPVEFSLRERSKAQLGLVGRVRQYPAIYAWASRRFR